MTITMENLRRPGKWNLPWDADPGYAAHCSWLKERKSVLYSITKGKSLTEDNNSLTEDNNSLKEDNNSLTKETNSVKKKKTTIPTTPSRRKISGFYFQLFHHQLGGLRRAQSSKLSNLEKGSLAGMSLLLIRGKSISWNVLCKEIGYSRNDGLVRDHQASFVD